jgi:hypothetical protein
LHEEYIDIIEVRVKRVQLEHVDQREQQHTKICIASPFNNVQYIFFTCGSTVNKLE